ncbi:hypothetical protein BaRGS_00004397 [Batillaria attramentaria]|uniref:Uncharacterized protein n=1 Tax=Batillaria attramentaria TaxID=370345 RepID=A0ABD0LZ53_9CAEN
MLSHSLPKRASSFLPIIPPTLNPTSNPPPLFAMSAHNVYLTAPPLMQPGFNCPGKFGIRITKRCLPVCTYTHSDIICLPPMPTPSAKKLAANGVAGASSLRNCISYVYLSGTHR